MTKKTITILSLLLFMMGTFVSAQAPDQGKRPNAEQRAKMQTAHMKENLNLTADQEKSVYNINLKHAQKAEDIFKGGAGNEGRQQMMQKNNDEKDAELKGVLTPDQYAKHEANKQSMKGQGGMRGGGPPPGDK